MGQNSILVLCRDLPSNSGCTCLVVDFVCRFYQECVMHEADYNIE